VREWKNEEARHSAETCKGPKGRRGQRRFARKYLAQAAASVKKGGFRFQKDNTLTGMWGKKKLDR